MSTQLKNKFHALRSTTADQPVRLQEMALHELTQGEVLIATQYSGINYKDALAVTNKGKILKRFPLNPGIDLAGVVVDSHDKRFSPGQEVLVTGCDTGESYDGGYAEFTRARADVVVPMPRGLSAKESMIIGTAGFTAALALARMQQNGQTPNKGPILVTGASGGVGQFAIELFARNGFEVHALSGKPESAARLKSLGATQVLSLSDLALGDRPLESVKWGGVVDNIGGQTLARLLAHTELWGNIASIGLAEGIEFKSTVMPMILRGVSLLGISSNNTPMGLREQLWQLLSSAWKPKNLNAYVSHAITLQEVPAYCEKMLARQTQGRILVRTGGQ